MRLTDIVCGRCQKSYHVRPGCGVCKPAKECLYLVSIDEGSGLSSTVNQSLRLLRLNLDRLEKDMEENSNLESGEGLGKFYPPHAKEAAALARALAIVGGEARKLEHKEGQDFLKMTMEERAKLLVKFTEELPPDSRSKLLRRFRDMYREVEGGAPE